MLIEEVTVELEYQTKESNKSGYCFKMIPVFVSKELQLLHICFHRQYVEFCAGVPNSSCTECKTCMPCSRFTSSKCFSLLNTIKITRMATQNSFVELCFRVNAYFSSIGILACKMPGFGGSNELVKEIKYPRIVQILCSGALSQKEIFYPIKSRMGL